MKTKIKKDLRKLKMKGIGWLKILYFFKGLIHRKERMINADNTCIQSTFTNKMIRDYESYSSKVIQVLDDFTSVMRSNIYKLITDYDYLYDEYQQINVLSEDHLNDVDSIRQNQKKQTRKNNIKNQMHDMYDEIKVLYDNIHNYEFFVDEELASTGAKIESVFSSYCHGAMFGKGWKNSYIPKVSINTSSKMRYQEKHQVSNDEITSFIESCKGKELINE